MSVNEWDVASGDHQDARSSYVALANDEPTPNPLGDDGQLSSTSLNDSGQPPAKGPRQSRLSDGRVSARSSGAELDRASMHEHAVEKGSTMQVSGLGRDGQCGAMEEKGERGARVRKKGGAPYQTTDRRDTHRLFSGRASV